jgi:hypothetical protein
MKPVFWDGGEHFDNPNLRWGDPAYLLEPGDPGYVPILPVISEPKNKTKRMRRNSYYPSRMANQISWLVNFYNKLPAYATALGLTTAQVNAAVADARWLVYVLQGWLSGVRAFSLAATDASTEAQSGTGGAAQVLPVFTAPALPTGVVAVNPGALLRIFALVQIINDSGLATEAIQSDLGIIGSEQTGPDLATVQPPLGAIVSGGMVNLKWNWNGLSAWLEACEILVDRADGKGFVLLTIDTTPNYTDTQPFPAAKTIWSYKAIYRADDRQVGLWSNTVSVTVGA